MFISTIIQFEQFIRSEASLRPWWKNNGDVCNFLSSYVFAQTNIHTYSELFITFIQFEHFIRSEASRRPWWKNNGDVYIFFSATSDVFLQTNLYTNVHTLNYSVIFVIVTVSERLKLFLLSDIKYRLKVLYRIYNISSSA